MLECWFPALLLAVIVVAARSQSTDRGGAAVSTLRAVFSAIIAALPVCLPVSAQAIKGGGVGLASCGSWTARRRSARSSGCSATCRDCRRQRMLPAACD